MFDLGIQKKNRIDRALRIRVEGALEQYYAPFDYICDCAEIVIVGLTPGRQQLEKAWSVARYLNASGKSELECKREALRLAAFCGPMRQKIVSMLDIAGLARYLRISTTAHLWEKQEFGRAQFISVAQNPVLNQGVDYSGYNPKASESELLLSSFMSETLPTLLKLRKLSIVLGRASEMAITSWMRIEPSIREIEWFFIPHTSGNSAGRSETFVSGQPGAINIKKVEFERIMDQRRRLEVRLRA